MIYRFYTLLIFCIAISACKGNDKSTSSTNSTTTAEIEQLEAKYRSSNDLNTANALLTKYAEYAAANPEDVLNNSNYLRRSARIYSANKDYLKAAGTTVLALKKYYNSNDTEANIASLVDYYQSLGNSDAAETTMNGYLMAFPNGSKVEDYNKRLGDKKQHLADRLKEIATEVVTTADGSPGLNKEAVNKFIGVAEIYALTNNTRDTLASDYLFKAGKLAMTIKNLEKAIECFQWIYTSLKSSKQAPSALFTHAFTLDNQLGRKDEAKGLYESFLRDYPEHHFADDAQFQLKNLGKDDAEIIKEFNEKANSK